LVRILPLCSKNDVATIKSVRIANCFT